MADEKWNLTDGKETKSTPLPEPTLTRHDINWILGKCQDDLTAQYPRLPDSMVRAACMSAFNAFANCCLAHLLDKAMRESRVYTTVIDFAKIDAAAKATEAETPATPESNPVKSDD